MSRIDQISVTPTVARQSQQKEFGEVLKESLSQGVRAVTAVSGAVMGAVPGSGIVSAAVSSVTALASHPTSSSAASTGVVNVGGPTVPGANFTNAAASGDMNSMVTEMRAEANRSMAVQMAMQQESRDYNTVTNVLKVRHDSAKAAINNIR